MDVAAVSFLRSEAGRRLLTDLDRRDLTDGQVLPVLEELRRELAPALASGAVETTRLRRAAATKFPRAGEMLFTREGLEQATGFDVARHRARRIAGLSPRWVADLGCGIGGDAIALADVAPVAGLDVDPVRLAVAAHNVAVHATRHPFHPLRADVLAPPIAAVDVAFADPARRAGGRRRLEVGDSVPPLPDLVDVWSPRAASLVIKTAPGIDHAAVPDDAELELVSLAGELKEAVLWTGEAVGAVRRRASRLPEGEELTDLEPDRPAPLTGISDWLCEPDPAVIRAGLVRHLAARHGAALIDPHIAYLTASAPLPTVLARSYPVETVMGFQLKRLRRHLRELGVGSVTVKKRGSPIAPEELRRRLDLTGSEHRVVVLTRVAGDPVAVIAGEPV